MINNYLGITLQDLDFEEFIIEESYTKSYH